MKSIKRRQIFDFHTCWSCNRAGKGFKGCGAHWQLLLKVKFKGEKPNDEFGILHMSCRCYLTDFTRSRIIGKFEERRQIIDVASGFDIAQTIVSRLWRIFHGSGIHSRLSR